MNSKKKRSKHHKQSQISISDTEAQVSKEEIQKRAYEIYEERQVKGISGNDDSDWEAAAAELQLRKKNTGSVRKSPLVVQAKQKNWGGRFLITALSIVLIAAAFVFINKIPKKAKQMISHPYVLDLSVGDVSLSHDQGTNWSVADPGMTINQNDILKTGLNSYCDVIMTGRGIFRVMAESEIHIRKLSDEQETLKVLKGNIAINVARKLKNDQNFEVETDVAVASVRGTRFFIEQNGDSINAVMLEGSLSLKRVLDLELSESIQDILEKGLEITVSPEQMYSVSGEDNKRLSQEVNSHFQDVNDIRQAQEYTKQYQQSEKHNIKKIEDPEIYNKQMNELNTPERLNKISANVLDYLINFETRQKELSEQSKAELEKVIALYKQNPKIKIEVQGHTDNEGDFEQNMRLSKKRAESVQLYLIEHGISEKSITANGYGDSQPVADNQSEKGKWMNRRTEIKVYIY